MLTGDLITELIYRRCREKCDEIHLRQVAYWTFREGLVKDFDMYYEYLKAIAYSGGDPYYNKCIEDCIEEAKKKILKKIEQELNLENI